MANHRLVLLVFAVATASSVLGCGLGDYDEDNDFSVNDVRSVVKRSSEEGSDRKACAPGDEQPRTRCCCCPIKNIKINMFSATVALSKISN